MEELVDIYDAERNRTGEARPREGLFLREGEYMLYVLALVENARGEFLITPRAPASTCRASRSCLCTRTRTST